MAKQAGPFFFVGTIDDLVFYKLGDEYYVRKKSKPTSGTQKRLKDKNVYPVMHMRQTEFGQASKLSSQVYRTLIISKRKHGLHGKLTREALGLLRQGRTHEEIKQHLQIFLAKLTTVPVKETQEKEVCKQSISNISPLNQANVQIGKTHEKGFVNSNGALFLPIQHATWLSTKPLGIDKPVASYPLLKDNLLQSGHETSVELIPILAR